MKGGAQPQRDFAPAAGAQCTWNHDKDNATRCNAWLPSTPANNAHFSAVCLFTALQVMRNHSGARPVGLVYSAFGGTSLSLWAPPAVYDGCPGAMAPSPPPGSLWNAMINPLVHYTVRSVLFFQGEQDAGAEAATPGWYACRFQRLIAHWRSAWGTGDFAFNYVQLGPVDPGSPSTAYGALRIAQGLAQPRPGGATDTTGMAAAYDLGDASSPYDSVHFRNKVEVGRRLAAAVLHTAFAQQYPAVNWAPPAVAPAVPDGPPPFSGLALALASEDGSGAALVDGGQCTECCARGAGSLVQLRQGGAAGAWVNASAVAVAAGGKSLRVTAPAPGNWSELRLAALNYPQCALVGSGNGFPVPAQLVAVGAAAAAAPAEAPAAVAAVERGQRSGAGSLQWRGRTYTWQGDEALPPVGLKCVLGQGSTCGALGTHAAHPPSTPSPTAHTHNAHPLPFPLAAPGMRTTLTWTKCWCWQWGARWYRWACGRWGGISWAWTTAGRWRATPAATSLRTPRASPLALARWQRGCTRWACARACTLRRAASPARTAPAATPLRRRTPPPTAPTAWIISR